MNKNPIYNALAASLYIIIVASVMFFGSAIIPKEDTVLAPISMLSLLTLSAAVMGYLFFFRSAELYMDNKKTEAVTFFFKTLSAFAVITAILFVLLISGLFTKGNKSGQITNFEECVAAGNPMMKSYPAQCRTPDGTLFIQEVTIIK